MVIDHVAWTFVPVYTVLGQTLHIIGRLTGPIMAYMIAEGYIHTRDVKKYALRLFIFTLISWVPYSLYETGRWPTMNLGVIYTLFLGLVAIWIWDKLDAAKEIKIIFVVMLCYFSMFGGDWGIVDVLCPLFVFIYRDDPKAKWISLFAVGFISAVMAQVAAFGTDQPFRQLFQFGIFIAYFILMKFYDGESGSRASFHKWFFYIFYPAHLLIFAAIKYHWIT